MTPEQTPTFWRRYSPTGRRAQRRAHRLMAVEPEEAPRRARRARAARRIVAAACGCLLLATATAALAATATFPTRYYPAPVASKGGALSQCPSPAGLEPFSAASVKAAKLAAASYPSVNETAALALSDQANWPQVQRIWTNSSFAPNSQTVMSSEPLAKSAYGAVVRGSCGQALVPLTQLVITGTKGSKCIACQSRMFFLNRRGRVLVYGSY
jgi:hypothetical protein